ncbi:hypothetical protein [Demequina silvatica]|uniref:hypothetical protein n=1 Tax=Demequina silvatica TaxID=1638988 RepID=UPI000783DC9B|nr:hypothetical protein [Demequina silvatica]
MSKRGREIATGIAAYALAIAGLVALVQLGSPWWVVLPIAFLAWTATDIFARPLILPERTPDPPARDAGDLMVTVTDWGPRRIDVLKAVRAEDGGARELSVLSDVMHRGDALIVRTGLSEAAAHDVVALLERQGATVTVR